MINILEQITKHREQRGWSEYQLAEKADLPQSTISSWYKKQMLPSLSSLEKICSAFDMTMAQFLMEDEELVPINDEQKQLLEHWSYLSKEQKEIVLKLIQVM